MQVTVLTQTELDQLLTKSAEVGALRAIQVFAENQKPAGDPSRLLSIDEVAERLQVTTATVKAWARSGKIPHKRVGRKILITEADLFKTLSAGGYDASAITTPRIKITRGSNGK